MIFEKYKTTLELIGDDVISHGKKIAELNRNTSTVHAVVWSGTSHMTHINYVAAQLEFTVKRITIDGTEI